MFFGLFQKKCPVCGMKVDKKDAVERSGKYFCSEKCAEEYGKKPELGAHHESHDDSRGCCGGH
ncbi:MAG: YHS domain-containing protein [Candidatus Niyogibacteria bacterium]|nr:YHS domain-containing protein [Candidatus Niyogibacteria bacterium]